MSERPATKARRVLAARERIGWRVVRITGSHRTPARPFIPPGGLRWSMAFGRHRQLVKTGSPAPDFLMPRLEGGEASLKDITAKGPALLAFFKVSCPVCQLALPFLDRIHASGALSVYGVCQNGPEDARDFQRRYGLSFPILLDPRAKDYVTSNAYGISTVPTLVLVESDGTISNVIESWSKGDVAALGGRAGVNPFRQGENVPEWKAG